MEQNKYREQIQNSAIIPSDGSWDKLSKKLTEHDNDRKNNKRLFMKYAASLLFIISIGFYFLPPENKISTDEIIASPEVDKSSVDNSDPEPFVAPTLNSTAIKKIEQNPHVNEIVNYYVEESVAINSKDNIEQNENSHKEARVDLTTKTSNVASLNTPNVDADYEVEELLKNANLNLEKNDPYLNKTKINAMVLLDEIEDDLEKDKRRKLFEKIIITIKNPAEIEITDRSK